MDMIPPYEGDPDPSHPKRRGSLRSWTREKWIANGVVSFIIGTAAFIFLWPLIAMNGGRPEGTRSISKVKQIVMSLQFYLADFDDTFPPEENWQRWHRRSLGPVGFEPPYKAEPGGYCYNSALAGLSRSKITKPEETPIVFGCRLTGADPYGGVSELRTQEPNAVVGLADGTARRLTIAEARSLIWNPKTTKSDELLPL